MVKTFSKFASVVVNACILFFPIFFAVTVMKTLSLEDAQIENANFRGNYQVTATDSNFDCSSKMLMNVSFAIILAGLWNAKTMMKIGSI